MKISRSVKSSMFTSLDVILLLGIFILIQFLAYNHPYEWDATANQRYSLSDLSKKVLASLDKNVDFWVFVARGDQGTRDLVHEYEVASSKVKVHYVDPNADPLTAREFGVNTAPPLIVVEYGNNKEQVSELDENGVTNAINRLVTGKIRTVYFLQGHGEPKLDSTDPNGYSELRDALTGENFVVKPLSFLQDKKIPDDASAIVIVAPMYSFFPGEVNWLSDYVKNGGRILYLSGLRVSKDGNDLLRPFGIALQSELVVDRDPRKQVVGGGEEFLVANNYGSNPVTQPFTGFNTPIPLILPFTCGLQGGANQFGGKVLFLVGTSQMGAAYPIEIKGKDLLVKKTPSQQGVISVGLMTAVNPDKGEEKEGKVLAIGSSLFADNQWINNYANRDFVLNAVSWAAESGNTIAIHPKPFRSSPLILDRRDAVQLFILSLIVFPGFGIVLGLSNWMRRRTL